VLQPGVRPGLCELGHYQTPEKPTLRTRSSGVCECVHSRYSSSAQAEPNVCRAPCCGRN